MMIILKFDVSNIVAIISVKTWYFSKMHNNIQSKKNSIYRKALNPSAAPKVSANIKR